MVASYHGYWGSVWCLKLTPTLELMSDKQKKANYMDFCHQPLFIIAVQGSQRRRWWPLTMATGAQCGV